MLASVGSKFTIPPLSATACANWLDDERLHALRFRTY